MPPPWKLDSNTSLARIEDPLLLWSRFAVDLVLPVQQRITIQNELASSMYWQSELGRVQHIRDEADRT